MRARPSSRHPWPCSDCGEGVRGDGGPRSGGGELGGEPSCSEGELSGKGEPSSGEGELGGGEPICIEGASSGGGGEPSCGESELGEGELGCSGSEHGGKPSCGKDELGGEGESGCGEGEPDGEPSSSEGEPQSCEDELLSCESCELLSCELLSCGCGDCELSSCELLSCMERELDCGMGESCCACANESPRNEDCVSTVGDGCWRLAAALGELLSCGWGEP